MAGLKVHPRDDGFLEDYKILKRRGHTSQEIARRLGVSRATLYRIVRELS